MVVTSKWSSPCIATGELVISTEVGSRSLKILVLILPLLGQDNPSLYVNFSTFLKTKILDWGWSSMIRCVPSMHQAPDSTPALKKTKTQQ